jgi:hypothetical protein
MGAFVWELRKSLADAVDGSETYKIRIYSGHDTTVGPLMVHCRNKNRNNFFFLREPWELLMDFGLLMFPILKWNYGKTVS